MLDGVVLGPDSAIPRWLPKQQICTAIVCSKLLTCRYFQTRSLSSETGQYPPSGAGQAPAIWN